MKNKIKLTIVAIAVLLLMLFGGHIVAKRVTLQGTVFSGLTSGGNYIDYFVNNIKNSTEFMKITWDNLDSYYFTANNETGSTTVANKRAVCINQNTSSAEYNLRMKPVAVIDIAGGLVKANGDMVKNGKEDEWIYIGDCAAKLARAAQYEGSHVDSNVEGYLNYNDENNKGWINFFNKATTILRTDGVYANFKSAHTGTPAGSYYNNLFPSGTNLNSYNILTSGSDVGTEANSNIKVIKLNNNQNGYQCRIGPYQLKNVQGSTDVTKSVTITFKDKSTVTGNMHLTNNDLYIYTKSDISNKTISSIKFKQEYKAYRAKIIVMLTDFYQNRLIMDGIEDGIVSKTVNLKIPKEEQDVSVQKYIVAYGQRETLNEAEKANYEFKIKNTKYLGQQQGENCRLNWVASNKTTDRNPSKNNEKIEKVKMDDPVYIQQNDYVVYKIVVYNNSDTDCENVTINERINTAYLQDDAFYPSNPYKIYKGTDAMYVENGYTYFRKNNEYDAIVCGPDISDDVKFDTYHVDTEKIEAHKSKAYFVILRYNKFFTHKVNNKVWLSGSNISKKYRTVDYDYVTMKKPDISLQKYITKVTSGNGNDEKTYKRENHYAVSKDSDLWNWDVNNDHNHIDSDISRNNKINSSTIKKDNPVLIEAGDKVTYKIVVYNNAETTTSVTVGDNFSSGGKPQITEIRTSEKDDYNNATIINDLSKKSFNEANTAYDGVRFWYDETNKNNKLRFDLKGNKTRYIYVTIKYNEYTSNVLQNKAWISYTTPNNYTDYRTIDADYVKMKEYKVSLEKYICPVNDNALTTNRLGKAEHNYDNDANTKNDWKFKNPVTVSQNDYITYIIKVQNDGDTKVYIPSITDTLPSDGVRTSSFTITTVCKYKKENNSYISLNKGNLTLSGNDNEKTITMPSSKQDSNYLLNPQDSIYIYIKVKVTASNMSLKEYQNVALITDNIIKNRNEIEIKDTTENNNKDSDYFQLKDIIIAGTVWNDKALDKKQGNYNGVYDTNQENGLDGIEVKLYRLHDEKINLEASTTTQNGGKYEFKGKDYDSTANYNIKTEKIGNIWAKAYNSYYIVFEYDGVTYTSTPNGQTCVSVTDETAYKNGTYKTNSNAREDNNCDKLGLTTRRNFNNKFATVSKDGAYSNTGDRIGISYNPINQLGHIPESRYATHNIMQSSTDLIRLSNNTNIEEQLKYVNLGLRGRDVFDLELTSDVKSVDVTVNGETAKYDNMNKVTVRKSDLTSQLTTEDMANLESETSKTYVDGVNSKPSSETEGQQQNIRNTDKEYLNSIYVTYKITVQNTSETAGTATKIINYYDSRYTFEKAYSADSTLTTSNGNNGTGYKSVIITTPGSWLSQSETMDIYVVYKLTESGMDELNKLATDGVMPTYNMAEIYEYKTRCSAGQSEYTRGLIDKDSQPGNVTESGVYLEENGETWQEGETTVKYYFNKKNLNKLKYEDDTYATPTLYFISDANQRSLSGVVYRDSTTTDAETKIKSGNGIKDDGEVGVYGANVKLTVDLVGGGSKTYEVTNGTNKDGSYTISGFIPGNAKLTYKYGDTEKTIVLNKSDDGSVNKYSYNGEDYQSTNNTNLDTSNNKYWYVLNKDKISIAKDNSERRKAVSSNVTNFNDSEMIDLNNIRAGKEVAVDNVSNIANKTNMFATTKDFTLSVEQTVNNNQQPEQKTSFSSYEITDMNFGIAEVPVTTIDLKKQVVGFTITDSAGDNIIAKATNNNGTWEVAAGNVLAPDDTNLLDVSIEDEKLQGARLEVTYNITSNIIVEKNFDGNANTVATITGLVDYIDNDLSYNETLGENSKYWEVTSYDATQEVFKEASFNNAEGEKREPKGTIDPEGIKYTTIVKAKSDNPILTNKTTKVSVPITLEKTLSSAGTTIGDIITSSIDTYEYDNNVEITGLDYSNTKTDKTGRDFVFRDRIRKPETTDPTTSRMIRLAGIQHDFATSETITIHPPTGENNNIVYYIVAVISLGVLATGIVLIKKYAIKK